MENSAEYAGRATFLRKNAFSRLVGGRIRGFHDKPPSAGGRTLDTAGNPGPASQILMNVFLRYIHNRISHTTTKAATA
jgi:hypothetical protein